MAAPRASRERMVLSGEGLSAGTRYNGETGGGRRHGGQPSPDRDLRLMALTHDVNFLSASQLVVLGWGDSGERTGRQRRLKRLHDSGYVDRFRPTHDPAPPSGTTDSLSGLLDAYRAGLAPRVGAYTPTAITSITYTEHDLQLASARPPRSPGSHSRSKAARFIGRMPFTWKGPHSGRIDTDTTGGSSARQPPSYRRGRTCTRRAAVEGYLEPDATLIGRSGEDTWAVLIEYDRTERPHKQIDRLRRYDHWLLSGWREGRFVDTLDCPVGDIPDGTRAALAPPDRDGRSDLRRLVRPPGRRPAARDSRGEATGRVHEPRARSRRRLDDATDAEPAARCATTRAPARRARSKYDLPALFAGRDATSGRNPST